MAKDKAPMPTAAPASDKKRAIDSAMAQIEKMYGKGSIMRFGDQTNLNVDFIPTGSLALDVALGIGGLPKGRIVEIYGPESSGKTTLALHVVAEAQKRGGEVAFVDAEHALDPTYARALGVNVEDMLISQPDTGEQALEKKLREKGASEAEARYAAEWLEAIGAIDDGDYAVLLAQHCARQGYGPRRVQEKLREKGVPRELWEDALAALPDPAQTIDAFLRGKLREQAMDEREKKRLCDALLRRGFSWGDVKAGLARLGAEAAEE